ncbi:XdhC family protein [Hydrotalea sp.]|uniref:XdhC family protein n=1 Tax=Hydrotalea sp. TaxID=2881279 RepID=UPI003D0F48B2
MKEIKDIIVAYTKACALQQHTALATVVKVEGSSYRRPGARMLVNETGEVTGAISGGCLEGDALKKALLAIHQNKNKIVVYDTTDEEDAKLGIQLGCNGIVSILFEPLPLEVEVPNNPINALRNAIADRSNTGIVICGFNSNSQQHLGTTELNLLPIAVQKAITDTLQIEQVNDGHIMQEWEGTQQQLFIQQVQPSIQLIIVGAGNDAIPLARMAAITGWQIILADGRKTHATSQRFPQAEQILVGKPQEVVPQWPIDTNTAIVLMTHNYNYDLAVLAELQKLPPLPYIGLLGPASKRERLLNELAEQGIEFSDDQKMNIYGPTGLNLGAETAEEIAVSIVAEIMSVLNKKNPYHLRDKSAAIHANHL